MGECSSSYLKSCLTTEQLFHTPETAQMLVLVKTLKTKIKRNCEHLRCGFRIRNMQKKPYLFVLNSGFQKHDLGQRNTVTPAGSNRPITPGSRFLPVRSRVCQRDSSNLRHRILVVSELLRVRTMSTTTESLQCH